MAPLGSRQGKQNAIGAHIDGTQPDTQPFHYGVKLRLTTAHRNNPLRRAHAFDDMGTVDSTGPSSALTGQQATGMITVTFDNQISSSRLHGHSLDEPRSSKKKSTNNRRSHG